MDIMLPEKISSYRKLMRVSLAYYRATVLRVLPLSLLLAITVFTPSLLWELFGIQIFSSINLFSVNNLWLILVSLIALVFYISMLWRIHCYMIHKKEPLIEDLRNGIRKFPLVFVANLVEIVIVAISALILFTFQIMLTKNNVVFGQTPIGVVITVATFAIEFFLIVYIFSLFIFLPALIATENKGILSAIRRSIQLVWNHWWRVVSVQLTPWILYYLTLILLLDIFKINLHIGTNATPYLSNTVMHILVFALYAPWISTLLLVQMNDLEIRNHLLASKRNEIIRQKLPG